MRKTFIDYVERMKQVRSLSAPSLDSISTADDYSKVLLENFRLIGQLAAKNRETVEEELLPLLQSKERLSEEELGELGELNKNLFDMESLEEVDQHVADLINERLIQEEPIGSDAGNHDERMITGLIKTMQIKYFLMIMASNRNVEASEKYREEGIEAMLKLNAYLEKEQFSKLSPEMQLAVFQNCVSGVLLYERNRACSDLEYARKSIEYLKREIQLVKDPFYQSTVDKDRKNIEFMIYYYFASLAEIADLPKEMAKEVYEYAPYALEFWEQNLKEFEKRYLNINATMLKAQVLKVALCAEDPSTAELYDELFQDYVKRDASNYDTIGVDVNLNLPGILYMVLVRKRKPGSGFTGQEMEQMGEYVRNMLAYLHHMPKNGRLVTGVLEIDELLEEYVELPGQLSFEEFCIQIMAAVHPPTYVHSNMVAKITACLVRNLIRMKPELFVSFPGMGSLETVLEKRDEIIDYAYHASLCHDVGKVIIIDTIGMYGRQLLESEYHDVRQHPGNGAEMAGKHKSTRKYVDVIRGHHLWYDGSQGYPDDFDASKSPYKVIIDVVTVADCLDAATDGVGRSYQEGKSLKEYERELKEGAGTRYAPYLPELFADPVVHEEMEFLLSEGRSKLYQDTYYLLRKMTK